MIEVGAERLRRRSRMFVWMTRPPMTDLDTRLTELIDPQARALGFDLVRVKLFGGVGDRTLQVMAERPDTRQLTIDDCAALSRRVSDVLDECDPIEEAYRLEVSSPGIDRPLTRLKDFADWQGHEARITLTEKLDGRKILTGDLGGSEDDRIVIAVRGAERMTVPFAAIDSAKLTLTDRLIAATQPLSTQGADDIIETPAEGTDIFEEEGQD